MKVELLYPRVDCSQAMPQHQDKGDVIEVHDDEGKRMLARGTARVPKPAKADAKKD